MKLVGETLTLSANHLNLASRGLHHALANPGARRDRKIRDNTDINGRLIAKADCYACGWNAGQDLGRMIEKTRSRQYTLSTHRKYDESVYDPPPRTTRTERRRRRAARRREQLEHPPRR
jgi:hypothetical protein